MLNIAREKKPQPKVDNLKKRIWSDLGFYIMQFNVNWNMPVCTGGAFVI